jgi:hypothetical protein
VARPYPNKFLFIVDDAGVVICIRDDDSVAFADCFLNERQLSASGQIVIDYQPVKILLKK